MITHLAVLALGIAVGWIVGARKGNAALATAKKVWNDILAAEQRIRGK